MLTFWKLQYMQFSRPVRYQASPFYISLFEIKQKAIVILIGFITHLFVISGKKSVFICEVGQSSANKFDISCTSTKEYANL